MSKDGKEFVKVQFYDADGDPRRGGTAVGYENLWAAPVTGSQYRIERIPFFIYGISRGDIVTAAADNEGRLQFGKVAESSGNRTLRARSDGFIENARQRKKVIADLKKRGADVEELRSRLLAVDVPVDVDLHAIEDYLTNDAKVSWEYGNPEESKEAIRRGRLAQASNP